MRGCLPDWNKQWIRQWAFWSGLACLSLSWSSPLALASPLFAGVTSIEAGPEQAGVQPLSFQSDLPFQYQLQRQDRDHVVVRLYNAQLSRNLLTSEGGVNLLAGGAIESASLKKNDKNDLSSGEYQEIILTGSGLGGKKLKISGATELPLSLANSFRETSAKSINPKKAQRIEPSGRTAHPVAQAASSQKERIAARPISKNNNNLKRLAEEPVAMLSATSGGPKIASVQNVTGPSIKSDGSRTTPVVVENRLRYTPSSPSSVARGVEAEAPAAQATAKPQDAPEPAYQILTPLPRYQGGAAPIVAMTTDTEGKPVMVRPKNQAIPEFAVSSENGGYNTLFQAEPDSDQQRVGRLMAESLDAYRNQQYEKALPLIQQALRLDADNADLYAALAEIQIKLNQPAQAGDAYRQASEKSAGKYGQRYAQVLVLAGKRQDAIQVLKKLYEKDSRQVEAAYMLGTLYEELGQTAEALPYLKQAAALHPASADIQYNLGLAYELSGDRLLAEKHYQQALILDRDAVDARKALARVKGD